MITQINKEQLRYLKLIALRPHVYEWSYKPIDQLLNAGLILKHGSTKNEEIQTTLKGKMYLLSKNFNLPVCFTNPFFIFKHLLIKPMSIKELAQEIEITPGEIRTHINKWNNVFRIKDNKINLIQQTKEQYNSLILELQY